MDFIFNDGLLYIAVKNIGARSAFKVSTQFDKEIVGVAGEKKNFRFGAVQVPGILATPKRDKNFSGFQRIILRSQRASNDIHPNKV